MNNNVFLQYWSFMYKTKNVFGEGPTILAKEAHQILKNIECRKMLEIGCGQGRDALYFSELGYKIEAFDISNEAIDFVKTQKQIKKLDNLELFQHDVKMPITKENYFDFVYSNLTLQFFDISNLQLILENISKCMNTNSLFHFSTKKIGDKYYDFGTKINENAFSYKGITRYFYEKEILENLFEDNFKIKKFESDKHTNLDNTISVWWKILLQKTD